MRNSNIHTDRKATLVNSILNRTLMLYTFLLSLSVGQMWGAYYVRGTMNSWTATAMTQSSANSNIYYYKTSGAQEFKVATSTTSWEYGSGAKDNSLGYLITLGGSDNITGGSSGESWYICFNSSTKKVFGVFSMNIAGENFPSTSSWSTSAAEMTYDGNSTFTKSFTFTSTPNCKFKITRCNTNNNWADAVGYSSTKVSGTNCNAPTGESGAGSNICFSPYLTGEVTITYNWSSGNITISCPKIPITFDKQSGSGGSDGVNADYDAAMPSITKPSRSGYSFQGYYSAAEGSGTQYYYYNGSSAHNWDQTSATTLYANWALKRTITMYYAAPADVVACNTVKCYINYGYDQATQDLNMTKTAYTYNGKLIYSIEVTANYDGFDAIYFKPKGTSGSGSEEQTGCNTRTSASSLSGRMYVHDSGWTDYATDASYTVYFVNQNSWTTPKAYAWNSDCDKNAEYATSGTMTNTGKTYNGKAIWSITFNKRYASIIFNSNGSSTTKTGNLTLGSTNAGKMFTFATSSTAWVAYTYDVAVTLHDNNGGSHNGSANVHYLSGTSFVSKTAPTKTGYTVEGYYKEVGTTTKIATSAGALQANTTYTNSSSQWSTSAQTLYTKWTAKTYDVILDVNGGSGANQTVVATYDAAMPTKIKGSSSSIAARSRTGYNFDGYTANNDGTGTKYYTSALASNHNWDIDNNERHIYAKWNPKQCTVSFDYQTSAEGYGAVGTLSSVTATYDASMPALSGDMPTAANGYAFMGFYSGTGGTGTKYYNANGSSANNWAEDTESTTTLYAYYKKAEITGITLSPGATVAPNTTVTVTPTVSPTPTGTYEICFQLLHGNGNPMDEQPTFTKVSNTVTFTVPEVSGTYLVAAILHTGTGACGSGTELDSTTIAFQVAGDHTVTVQYKDASGNTIQASETVTGRPLAWSGDITAPTIFGYTFARWDAGDGVTIKDGSGEDKTTSTSSTIKIKAVYDGKLTAVYNQKAIIYFKNTLNWDTVLVNLYSDSYWNNPKGSGNKDVTNRNKGMTHIAGTDIWYYDYGTAGITPSLYVSFTDAVQNGTGSGSENFWLANPGVNVVYPANYPDDIHTNKSSETGFKAATPMFVPTASQSAVVLNNASSGKANYYNAGYWTKYTPGTGYTLEIYNNDGDVLLKSVPFTSEDDLMPMKAVVDLEANYTSYKFQLKRDGDVYYGNSGTMTYNNCGQDVAWDMSNSSFSQCGLTTNAAGNYTFTLSYAGHAAVNPHYRLRMKVDYPISNGDYRVIYDDNVQANFKASAIIAKVNSGKDTVSFFIRPGNTPVMKIQQSSVNALTGAVTWNDYSAISTYVDNAGTNALSKDSVYKICLTMNESGAISVEKVEVYTGNYYIRTDAANSKWDNYRSDPDHLMTYSEYSITHGGYSHYFCHWVQANDSRKNVKFCIANDYSPSISDTLIRETASGEWANINNYIDAGGNILRNANVRFMWNRHDNSIKRAYVDGAQEDGSHFLQILSSDSKIKNAAGDAVLTEVTFKDNQNWIYEANIKAQPTAQIKLKSTWGTSNTIEQYFKGSSSTTETLIGGSGSTWYTIRLLYDFKTNRLVASWLPSGEITGDNAINADVMFIREHQGDIAQLTFHDGSSMISKIETAYGVIRFNKYTLNNKEKTGAHSPLASPLSPYERALYFISFPFRVKLSEVFGFGKYAQHWIIQYYDGAARAAEGYWAESNGFWKYVWDRKDFELEPNTGYLLGLDLDELTEGSSVWNNGVENVELFFPSYGTMPDIKTASVTHTIEAHTCTINRTTEGLPGGNDPRTTYDRRIVDSHWNVLSVPTYVNTAAESFANTDWITTGDGHLGPKFLYTWNMDDNTITATSGSSYVYKAMHAYMVQYYGNVTWNTSSSPASIVARHTYAEPPKEVEFRLELQQNGQRIDHAFIDISDNEETDANFAFGEDLCKEFNTYKANIYSFTADRVVVAGNTMPMSNHILSMPIGVQTTTAGDYTFALPDGTSGIGVTLFDSEENIRTNLSALNYTVTLPVGTFDNRFFLEISPVPQTPTGIDNSEVSNQPSGARKIIIDQQLYIIKDGKLYDARGVRIE